MGSRVLRFSALRSAVKTHILIGYHIFSKELETLGVFPSRLGYTYSLLTVNTAQHILLRYDEQNDKGVSN